MKNTTKPFSQLLKTMSKNGKPELDKDLVEAQVKELQLRMLRIQQGIWHKKGRAVIMLEGFDAAGKGGAIRKITEMLDPRSVRVIPIGAPSASDQGTHWLYRFWKELPYPGSITIFDRSWYGRVLVEKVESLTPAARLKEAYREINEFEAQLINEGIPVIKIFLAITKNEQLARFDSRLSDPYKQWKITMDDINARKKWDQYVKAVDELIVKTDTKICPWHVVPADSKKFTRREILKIVTHELKSYEKWMEQAAHKYEKTKLVKLLRET
jgi:AMP-polyphosphate phosphotransferase